MYTTTTNRITGAIVEAIRPIMLEVYKKTSDVAKFGFEFDANGQLSCSRDKEFDDAVQGMLSCMSVAKFRKEHSEEVKSMGFSLDSNGRLVPLRTMPERFAELTINPLGDAHQLICAEDCALKACLKALDKGSNEEIKAMRMFIESEDSMERLIVAAPWRIALSKLYSVFIDKQFAVDALNRAEPIQVLGLVMVTNIFAKHLRINMPGWYDSALKYAYLLARAYYA